MSIQKVRALQRVAICVLPALCCLWPAIGFSAAPGPQENASAHQDDRNDSQGDVVHEHTNQLINETSPYLLQHAHNPVNWYPWGPEAFAKAKAENKPIFLSVGYSTCYWCHVMERESFEHEDVAKILNEKYIAIKVDREERPEVDQQYMMATQLITGQGGWPNSVWLTPDGKPWMAGTYFPNAQFKKVLDRLSDLWTNRNGDALKQADRLTAAIEEIGAAEMAGKPLSAELLDKAIQSSSTQFDNVNGGFGGAPKFPPHAHLAFLIDQYRRNKDDTVLNMIETTLSQMSRGGVYDQIGGGFHRYSTDDHWLLPHFEKMLYDNGQLMRSYTDGFLLTSNSNHRDTVEGIYQWLTREMTSPEGGFYSAVDSESNAEEGQFYVWTYDEIVSALGADDGKLFADVYGVQKNGNFKEEASGQPSKNNVLHLEKSIDAFAKQNSLDAVDLANRLSTMRDRLLKIRQQREYPHLDDKVIAAWNGLMIEGLAYAGRKLDEPKYTQAAQRAADFLLDKMTKNGKLQRTYRAGQAKLDGYLNDYAFVAAGLLELHRASGDETKYLEAARQLADIAMADFEDKQGGGFYFTAEPAADGDTEFVIRSKNLAGGGNLPTGNGVLAQVLFALGKETGESKYPEAARKSLSGLSGYIWQSAGQADHLLIAAAASLDVAGSDATVGSGSNRPDNGADAAKPDATFEATAVKGEVFLSRIEIVPGESFQLAVRLNVADGYHLYGPNPGVSIVYPSSLIFADDNVAQVGKISPPTGIRKMDAAIGEKLETYEGVVTYYIDLKIPADAKSGDAKLKFKMKTQACDEKQCSAPQENDVELQFHIQSEGGTSNPIRHAEIFSAIDRD